MTTRKRRPDIAPVMHPAAKQRAKVAYARWLRLRDEHRVASDRMWAGTIAINFTADELALIPDLLSPHDRNLFEAAKR